MSELSDLVKKNSLVTVNKGLLSSHLFSSLLFTLPLSCLLFCSYLFLSCLVSSFLIPPLSISCCSPFSLPPCCHLATFLIIFHSSHAHGRCLSAAVFWRERSFDFQLSLPQSSSYHRSTRMTGELSTAMLPVDSFPKLRNELALSRAFFVRSFSLAST